MQEHARQVMPTGVRSPKVDIEQMRQPRDGMPVASSKGRESPFDAGRVQSVFDMGILDDVERIIVLNEILPECLQVWYNCEHRYEDRNDGCRTPGLVSCRLLE